MSPSEICANCRATLVPGARFCPLCGSAVSSEQANWYDRLSAAGVDGALFVACTALLLWIGLKWWIAFPIWLVLTEIGYQLRGSIGKSLLGQYIKGKNRRQHYLRETIGKFASLATFGIGFLMILSKERLALHDYMAKTSVLRIGTSNRVRQAFVSAVLLTGAALVAYFLFNPNKATQSLSPFAKKREITLDSIVAQMPAVMTIYIYNGQGKTIGQGSGLVGLPARGLFHSSEEYYATQFHELAHSTGHAKRLHRQNFDNPVSFGSESYSKEELVADMTAAMLCGIAGIEQETLENSAAYLKTWIARLKSDSRLLVSAASHAQKAADFIQGKTANQSMEAEAA